LSDAYFKDAQFEKARKHLRLAVLIEPENPRYRGRLAVAGLASGDAEGYFTQIKTAAALTPDFMANELTLILALLQSARCGEALERATLLADDKTRTTPHRWS